MNSRLLRPLLASTFRRACFVCIVRPISSTTFVQSRVISKSEDIHDAGRADARIKIDGQDLMEQDTDAQFEDLDRGIDQEQFDRIIQEMHKRDDGSVFGPQKVRDRSRKLHLSQMEDENDSLSKPINQWREILYEEGELDQSDLSKHPSENNPHPFDPTKGLPPTHAFSLASYVNHLPGLQKLLDLGVDLLTIDTTTGLGRELVKMDWNKDIRPKLQWLVRDVGVDLETMASYLNRNPYFLVQDLDNLKIRVDYLKSKKFNAFEIKKIVVENRNWLNMDIKIIDSRLGYFQNQFQLPGDDIRKLIVKEPRIFYFGLGPIQRLLFMFNQTWGLSPLQIKQMLLKDPRVFLNDPKPLLKTYNYLTRVMKLTNEHILEYPFALRCEISQVRRRHEFLKRIKKAQYHSELPNYISLEMMLHPSDKYFAECVARVFVKDYNNFLKTL